MDAGNISAIISAGAGISGVLLGNLFVLIKEHWRARSEKGQGAAYLSIIVVSHLERLANECIRLSDDDGTDCGQPAGSDGMECAPTLSYPKFNPLDLDVDWKLLPKDLLYSILWLPDKQERLQSELSAHQEYCCDPPWHTEYFWMRRRGFAELGLAASDLANRLRQHAGLPIESTPPDEWSRDKHMSDVIKEIDSRRAAKRRRDEQNPLVLDLG